MSQWYETLNDHLTRANDLLKDNDRNGAATEMAKASKLLFDEAGRAGSLDRKKKLAQRAAELLQTSTMLQWGIKHSAPAHFPTPRRNDKKEPQQQNNDLDENAQTFDVITSNLTLADVAGLDSVKSTCSDYIEMMRHIERAKQRDIKTGGVMLFYGPPGTGKTMLGSAIAGELGLPFMLLKCDKVLSSYYAKSIKSLAAFFEQARSYRDGTVVFFDEIDSIAGKRSGSSHEATSRILTHLLQELGGADSQNDKLLFLAGTNLPWNLDSALISRTWEKCYVPLPDAKAREAMIIKTLAKEQFAPDFSIDELVTKTDGLGGREVVNICTRAKMIVFLDEIRNNISRGVNTSDFETAMKNVKRSTDKTTLKKYEEWGNS
jgi:SpoVK/Ycf46/Vps4 family AAA+-type ATPase